MNFSTLSSLRFALAALFILALPPGRLFAHAVWIEPLAEGGLALRFGEWGEEPEKSPGNLDLLIAPQAAAATDGLAKPVTLEKKADHYLLAGLTADLVAAGQADYEVMTRGGTGRRPIFTARWWPATRPALKPSGAALDLLPAEGVARRVFVSFRGKAVPAGTEVKFHAPGVELVKLVVDATGHVQVPEVKNAGLCLLYLGRYSEEVPGEFQGKKYDVASHSATLCWRVEK